MNSLSSRAKVARSSGDQPARARLVHTERVSDPGHGRPACSRLGHWTDDQHATLTEAGTAAHAELLRKVSRNRERLSAGITLQEYGATIDILRRMAVNLGRVESS